MSILSASDHHQWLLFARVFFFVVQGDREVHLLYSRIRLLLTIVRKLILKDVVNSICVALSSKVDAQGEEGYDQEAEDNTAHNKQYHVLFDKPGHNIVVIFVNGQRIWLVGPLAQV